MTQADDKQAGAIFEALIKEAEFLRAEALWCIQHVRNLAVQSTYIAGSALPIIAALIGVDVSHDSSAAARFFSRGAIPVIIQFLCLGVSITSLAFLRIYMGSFLQIFTFARYFRQHLIPTISKSVGNPPLKLFYWENWLKEHRSTKLASVGDVDLAAEPVLMGLYIVLYAGGFVTIGLMHSSFVALSIIVASVIAGITTMTFIKFLKVLRQAVTD